LARVRARLLVIGNVPDAAFVGVELDALGQLTEERSVSDRAAEGWVRLEGQIGLADGQREHTSVRLLARGDDVCLCIVWEQLLAQIPDPAHIEEVLEGRGDDSIQGFAL